MTGVDAPSRQISSYAALDGDGGCPHSLVLDLLQPALDVLLYHNSANFQFVSSQLLQVCNLQHNHSLASSLEPRSDVQTTTELIYSVTSSLGKQFVIVNFVTQNFSYLFFMQLKNM